MFKKLLASVGIGAAKVDTRLYNDSVAPGDVIEGEVHIMGGDAVQDIEDIYLKVATQCWREVDDSNIQEEVVMVNYRLLEKLTIKPHEEAVIPFSIQLPYETPLTLGNTPVYIRTGLDIKAAVDPKDIDALEVIPHPLMERTFIALENLGFHLHQANCYFTEHFHGSYPFIQEFELRPTGEYSRSIEELEIIFRLTPHELEILMEIDKRDRGIGGFFQDALDMDERYVRFYLAESDLEATDVEAMIDDILQSHFH
jgi:sporulation-control protein